MKNYTKLTQYLSEIYHLDSISSILHWDSSTVMPLKGALSRSNQLELIQKIVHNKISSPILGDLIEGAKAEQLNDWQKVNLSLAEKKYKHASVISTSIVSKLTKATSNCEIKWRQARYENNYKLFADNFAEVLELTKEIAYLKAESFKVNPYEVLLDQFDPNRKVSSIESTFANLIEFLPNFIKEVIEYQNFQENPEEIKGIYSKDKQKSLGLLCMEKLGFDFEMGRLDESIHPFCGGTATDVRITTRYDENNFLSALMGIQHETGHAIYEQNLPREYLEQPIGKALGMSIHESQSLLIEMQLCRSEEFLEWISTYVKKYFGDHSKYNPKNLWKINNRVQPSFIRVDADEVTYPIHIIIRYELEKSLLSGGLSIEDIPGAWNEKMYKYLNIIPRNYSEGCLQDIHWSLGLFGYFPCYTLGAIIAAQFFNEAKKTIPDLMNKIRKGNFEELVTWLKTSIHSKGSFYSPDQLLENVTGRSIDIENYKNYLKNKYLNI